MAPWGPPERILAPLACLSFPRSAFSARSFQQNPCSVHGAAPPHQEPPQQSAPTLSPSWLPSSGPRGSAPSRRRVKSKPGSSSKVPFMWFPPDPRTPPACCLRVCGLFLQPPFEKHRRGPCFPLEQASTRAPPHTPGARARALRGQRRHPALGISPEPEAAPGLGGQPPAGLVVLQTPGDQHLPRASPFPGQTVCLPTRSPVPRDPPSPELAPPETEVGPEV